MITHVYRTRVCLAGMYAVLSLVLFFLPHNVYASESTNTGIQTESYPAVETEEKMPQVIDQTTRGVELGGHAAQEKQIEEQQQAEDKGIIEKKKEPLPEKPLYSAGPWSGKIIDSKTRLPIEGAVVAAIWLRIYDTRFTVLADLHEAREVLTDKNGFFEIPVFVETGEDKESWPKPQIMGGGGPIEMVAQGPIIKDPDFVIYKPGFHSYPERPELVIFATSPFQAEFQELYSGKDKVFHVRKSIRDFQEGLVYSGEKCSSLIEKLSEKKYLAFHSLFLATDNAHGKIKSLNVPLECPREAEPIPTFVPGYRHELADPFKKGGYVIIELLGTTSYEERLKALPKDQAGINPERLPLLYRSISEENEYLKDKINNK